MRELISFLIETALWLEASRTLAPDHVDFNKKERKRTYLRKHQRKNKNRRPGRRYNNPGAGRSSFVDDDPDTAPEKND